MKHAVTLALVVASATLSRAQDRAPLEPTQVVTAPGRLGITPDARVGWRAERTLSHRSGQPIVESYAIVGESDDAWHIEASCEAATWFPSFPELRGALLALTVSKSDGVVTRALLGKPGEATRVIEVGPVPPRPPAPTLLAGTLDRVTLRIGAFEARKFEVQGFTSWIGAEGETKGVPLKFCGPYGVSMDYELAALPSKERRQLGETVIETVVITFTNGMKVWMTDHPIVLAFFGVGAGTDDDPRQATFRVEWGTTSDQVTSVGTDATPRLAWD